MNKQYVYLPIVVLVTTLVACTPPEKDIPGLTAGIDAAVAGHYGQSIYHEELAQDHEEKANNVLKHWKKDQYWNIDEHEPLSFIETSKSLISYFERIKLEDQ